LNRPAEFEEPSTNRGRIIQLPQLPALQPGVRLGPYEILSALRAGGMSDVYCPRATHLSRDVALRVWPEAGAGDPRFRERFEREARTIPPMAIIEGGPWLLSHRQEGQRNES
jgi:serine/threonine protein kinase